MQTTHYSPPRLLLAAALLVGAGLAQPVAASETQPPRPPAPLAYDPAAYEVAAQFPLDPAPWNAAALRREIGERVRRERARRELLVDYYRIGHTLAFPLPVATRPTAKDLPPGIATITYPWLIWLSWALEERWRVAHVAWRQFGDGEAGALLQRELAALHGWDHFWETRNEPGLATAHVAGCLAQALARTEGWDPALLREARAAAAALVERDVWPWFEKTWGGPQPLTPRRLVNIPVITLSRAAQLARIIGSPRSAALDAKTTELLHLWRRARLGRDYHTEGTAYDGYLMDSLTEWLAGVPERDALQREAREAFRSLAHQWIDLTTPGRFDLHAPVGDVEPEMTYWAPPLLRLAKWYEWHDTAWLLARVPLNRLPAAALVEALGQERLFDRATAPAIAPREHPHAVTLRTGWMGRDLAAVVSVPRTAMGHLQADTGQVVLGWHGRTWISDPGYQQYRPGEERAFTLGVQAHNYPVINGAQQKPRAGVIQQLNTTADGAQHTRIDLTPCYEKLPPAARVQRDVWLAPDAGLVVRDTLIALGPNADVGTHWLGGTHLAWAFVEGWARLSDGQRVVWIGSPGAELAPATLTRHAGSRGPLTIAHSAKLPAGAATRWWVFWCDEAGSWRPPTVTAQAAQLSVKSARGATRMFAAD